MLLKQNILNDPKQYDHFISTQIIDLMKSQKRQVLTQSIGLLKIKKRSKKQSFAKPSYQLRDLKDTNCYIDDGKYKNQLRRCFQEATDGQFRSLSCSRNQANFILQQISHINLTKLRVLQLGMNYIQNIQPLTWLNAMNLRVLDLRQNLIVSSKPLAKFYTNSISEIKIGQNLFPQLYSLTRMKFRLNQYTRDLSIKNEYIKSPYNYSVSDIYFLSKLQQPKNLHQQWINVYAKNRIKLPKLEKAITRKSRKNRSTDLILTNSNF